MTHQFFTAKGVFAGPGTFRLSLPAESLPIPEESFHADSLYPKRVHGGVVLIANALDHSRNTVFESLQIHMADSEFAHLKDSMRGILKEIEAIAPVEVEENPPKTDSTTRVLIRRASFCQLTTGDSGNVLDFFHLDGSTVRAAEIRTKNAKTKKKETSATVRVVCRLELLPGRLMPLLGAFEWE